MDTTPEPSGATLRPSITLSDSNINHCKSFLELYSDCELRTTFPNEKTELKITKDLELLETELFSVITSTQESIEMLQKTMDEMKVEDSVESQEKIREDQTTILQDTHYKLATLTLNFTRTKTIQHHLNPIQNMGGYRSLIICLIDTLSLVIKELEKTSTSSFLSRGGRAVVSSLQNYSPFRKTGSMPEAQIAVDDSYIGGKKNHKIYGRADLTQSSNSYMVPPNFSSSLEDMKMSPDPIAKYSPKEKKKNRSSMFLPVTKSSNLSEYSTSSTPKISKAHIKSKSQEKKVVDSMEDVKIEDHNQLEGSNQEYKNGDTEDREAKKKTPFSPISDRKKTSYRAIGSPGPRKKKVRAKKKKSEFPSPDGVAPSIPQQRETPISLDVNPNLPEDEPILSVQEVRDREKNAESQSPPLSSLASDGPNFQEPYTPTSFQSTKEIREFYQKRKESLKKEIQLERDQLIAALKALDEREQTTLLEIEKEEKGRKSEFRSTTTENQLLLRSNTSSRVNSMKQKETQMKLIKRQVRQCEKASKMIESISSKLIVCATIPEGDLFMDIYEMYENTSHKPEDMFVESHFGYEVDKSLKEYGKKMKVVYCAVKDSKGKEKGITSALQKQMHFSMAAMRYLIQPKQASVKYGDIRSDLNVEFVRNVWDLLEDPMTSFFATQFGFAPVMEKMKVNLEVRVPVLAEEVLFQVNEHQQKLYQSRSISMNVPEKETIAAPSDSPDTSHHSSFLLEKPSQPSVDPHEKENDGEGETHRTTVTPIGIPGEYLIRCRFLNPYAREVDPSLVIKTNTRSNFLAKDTQEMMKTPDTLTRIFGKNLTQKSNKKRKEREDTTEPQEDGACSRLIIHIHGGGWVSQSPDQHVSYVSEWAKMANSPVLSIDYSLSPESQFPIAPNECYSVYKWVLIPENAALLGLSRKLQIVVCGDSAGGNLTCAVVLKAISDKIPLPIGLLLHYPAGLLSNSGSLSRMIFSNDPILNYQTMKVVLACYLGGQQNEAMENEFMSPAFASDEQIEQFPPTVICVGDVDPLIDDSTYMFDRFQRLGVCSILRIYRALPHGYLNLPTQLPDAIHAISAAGEYMHWLFAQNK